MLLGNVSLQYVASVQRFSAAVAKYCFFLTTLQNINCLKDCFVIRLQIVLGQQR